MVPCKDGVALPSPRPLTGALRRAGGLKPQPGTTPTTSSSQHTPGTPATATMIVSKPRQMPITGQKRPALFSASAKSRTRDAVSKKSWPVQGRDVWRLVVSRCWRKCCCQAGDARPEQQLTILAHRAAGLLLLLG